MKTPRIRDIRSVTTLLLFGGVFIFFAWWKFRLGQVRYFDADEMAYLHWAHNVYSGQIPMIDFLMYAPPGFLYLLSIIYAIASGTVPLFVARGLAWGIFVGICIAAGRIGGAMRGGGKSDYLPYILPGLILICLPIPADKFLEIRPDNLSILLALSGMIMQIRSIRKNDTHTSGALNAGFWTGILYASSLLILPKTLPQFGVALVVYILWYRAAIGPEERSARGRILRRSAIGFLLPVTVFAIWMVAVSRSLKHIGTIVYSLLLLPGEVNRIAEKYAINPNMFFYPNPIYYGNPGWTGGVIGNHVLWLVGMFAGIIRFFTPYTVRDKDDVWEVWLPAITFVTYIFAFMYWYPLRHAQYLIPVGVFVAVFVSDAIVTMCTFLGKNRLSRFLIIPLYLALLMGLNTLFFTVNMPKFGMDNAEDLRVLRTFLTRIPNNAYVFDLVGSTVYFRDPYFVSAVPFGEWMPYLSRPLAPVRDALESTRTRYIYAGLLGRVNSLAPEDRRYISLHFEADPSVNGLLVRKK